MKVLIHKYIVALIEVIGICCLVVGISSLFGFVVKHKQDVGMAFSTSVVTIFIGVGFILIAILLYEKGSRKV